MILGGRLFSPLSDGYFADGSLEEETEHEPPTRTGREPDGDDACEVADPEDRHSAHAESAD